MKMVMVFQKTSKKARYYYEQASKSKYDLTKKQSLEEFECRETKVCSEL